jgi:hypothetical protein
MERAEVRRLVEVMLDARDPELEYTLRHPDFVADMPQSGERFPSRDSLREMQRGFPGGPPEITLRRLVGDGDVWVAEATNDYGGEKFFAVLIIELRDDLIWRETRYYCQALDAPEWRAAHVEPMPPSER